MAQIRATFETLLSEIQNFLTTWRGPNPTYHCNKPQQLNRNNFGLLGFPHSDPHTLAKVTLEDHIIHSGARPLGMAAALQLRSRRRIIGWGAT
jgi:hypothetical protein